MSQNGTFLSLSGLEWTALSAIGTLFVAIVAVVPIGAAVYAHFSRRGFLRRRLHTHLTVIRTKLNEVLADKKWNSFTKTAFEETHRTNFDAIEYLSHAADVLPPAEQDKLLDFVVYFKTTKNMRNCPEFTAMADRIDAVLRLLLQKTRKRRR